MVEPPIFASQQGSSSLPSTTVLNEALLWDYSVRFWLRGDTRAAEALAIEITYNEKRSESYSLALEDVEGVAQIRITPSANVLVLVPETTVVAAGDGTFRYCRDDGSMLSFDDVEFIPERTFVLQRLNIIEVQSVRVAFAGEGFAAPLVPSIEIAQRIDFVATGSIAEQLTKFLESLLGNSPFATQPTAIECRYGYSIGGLPVQAPVVLVTRQDVAIGLDELLTEQVAASIVQWLAAVQPPATEARLVLTVTLWCAVPRIEAPLLRLRDVSIPLNEASQKQ